jgi:diguanylate cyclase (GGDEF)-like protein
MTTVGQDLKKYLYFLVSILAFILFTALLYYKFDQIIALTKEQFVHIKLKDAAHGANVIQNYLLQEFEGTQNVLAQMEKDLDKREKIDKFLSGFIDDEYRYVYLIYKDAKGFFRYFADGSLDPEERGDFGQKFFPLEEKLWQEIFEAGQSRYFSQQKIDSLWITYLLPIHLPGADPIFLVMDISTKAYARIETILKNLKHYLEYVLIFFALVFIVILGLYFLIYKENRRNFIDPLTQIYNRNYLKRIENSLPLERIAVAMIDIDYFKNVNDIYGHDVGDKVLQEVARLIQRNIRKEDILIRYGGEEFLLIIRKDNPEGVRRMISRIHSVVESTPIQIDGITINVTLSIGLNEIPQADQNIFDAIKKADMKLYQAKHNGRNRIEILSNDTKRQTLISFEKISDLIINKQVEIHFQPIFDLKTREIFYFEALARLKDGEELIFPGNFLPIISKTNYYIDFNVVLLEKVFELVRRHEVSIGINFKKSDFLDTKLFAMIEEIVVKHEKFASYLVFEILEDEEVKITDEGFFDRIKRLKRYGIKIAIDDFGSGYSNIHYFLHISPDIVKIDGGIVKQVVNNERAREIIKSIAIFSRYIKSVTIAEFIEDEQTLEILKKLGVKFGQGFYLSRPVTSLSEAKAHKVLDRIYADAV